jgi:hypothetical protein
MCNAEYGARFHRLNVKISFPLLPKGQVVSQPPILYGKLNCLFASIFVYIVHVQAALQYKKMGIAHFIGYH